MSGSMWYGLLRFLNLLDDLTTYFSIQLGRCVLLSFPVLALILILRRGVFMKTTFLKGMVWGIFAVVPFLGKLKLFYDRPWMPGVYMWWNDLCMVCRPVRYGYMLGIAVCAGVMIGKRRRLCTMMRHFERRYICGQEILVSEMAAVPFASGLFHARIAVPRAMIEEFREEELEMILLHEKMHIRLGHLRCLFLGDVLRVLLWPNFFIGRCMRTFRKDLEDICDQVTIQESGGNAYEYGRLLIKSMKALGTEAFEGTAAFAGEKEYRDIRQRIRRITEYEPYDSRRIRAFCACGLAVLAGIFLTVRDHSLPRYVKLTDMVLENDAGEFWILKDSGILRKAVSADDERVMIDRAAMDLILEEYEIEEREFSILFGGYEKLPGFGGNGNLVYVDYAGQEERLEIPYENSDAYITVMILKWI